MSDQTATSQPPVSQPTQATSPQPTPQEVINTLAQNYQEKLRELNVARENLSKNQDVVIAAQENAFKAYQTLSMNKERYYINVLNSQQAQIRAYIQALNDARKVMPTTAVQPTAVQPTMLPSIPESPLEQPNAQPNVSEREDNLN